jgi:hypothetical protein
MITTRSSLKQARRQVAPGDRDETDVNSWLVAVAEELADPRRFAVLFDRIVEEAADRGGGVRADEACDGLSVAEDDDGRDALDAVASGELLFGVDVDLRELDLARALGDF